MAKNTGILLNAEGDILIQNGHIAIGDTTYQNIYLILTMHKGELKEYPTLGLGISDVIADDDTDYWNYAIRKELQKDEIKVNKLEIHNNNILIDAKYI